MFYIYRLSDNRIISASPDDRFSIDPVTHGAIETSDTTAYDDPANVYKIKADLSGTEIDPTWTPPAFDLTTAELKALLKLIIDQLNIIRTNPALGLPAITYDQARGAIKAALGK